MEFDWIGGVRSGRGSGGIRGIGIIGFLLECERLCARADRLAAHDSDQVNQRMTDTGS